MPSSDPVQPLLLPFDSMGPSIDFEVPLRYSDMDMFGYVNNARYFSFLEEARIAWSVIEPCLREWLYALEVEDPDSLWQTWCTMAENFLANRTLGKPTVTQP